MCKRTVKLLDANNLDFESNNQIGISINTIAERTKSLSIHGRNKEFDMFISVYKKNNYHIYIPIELRDYEIKLANAISSNDRSKACEILTKMCDKSFKRMFSIFYQLICIIVILMAYVDNNISFDVEKRRINTYNNDAFKVINFANFVILTYAKIESNIDVEFNDYYGKTNKNKCNEYGNNFFHRLLEKYPLKTNSKKIDDLILCGNSKLIRNFFKNKGTKITLDVAKQVYSAYFHFRNNDKLMREVFLPYIVDAINNDNRKFEFNHIPDAFLVYCAKSLRKTGVKVKIMCSDKIITSIFPDICYKL